MRVSLSERPSPLARLGFAIPTYKRPDLLAKAVQSIIHAGRAAGVPICITDDSTDDTNAAVIRQLRSDYQNIIWIRNERNLGIDRNILNAVDLCPSEYVWILGEDDQVLPPAVESVLRLLDTTNTVAVPFLCVNYAAINATWDQVLKEHVLPQTAGGWREAAEFLAHDAWAIGFIGACVVRKDLWAAVDRSPYVGTYYAHVGIIMDYLQQKRLYVLATPLVHNRCSSPAVFTWSAVTSDVLDGWVQLMDRLTPHYGMAVCAAARRAFEVAHGLHTLKFLCYLRSGNALNWEVCRRWIWPAAHPFWYKVAAGVLTLMPVWIFRLAQQLMHNIIGRRIQ